MSGATGPTFCQLFRYQRKLRETLVLGDYWMKPDPLLWPVKIPPKPLLIFSTQRRSVGLQHCAFWLFGGSSGWAASFHMRKLQLNIKGVMRTSNLRQRSKFGLGFSCPSLVVKPPAPHGAHRAHRAHREHRSTGSTANKIKIPLKHVVTFFLCFIFYISVVFYCFLLFSGVVGLCLSARLKCERVCISHCF